VAWTSVEIALLLGAGRQCSIDCGPGSFQGWRFRAIPAKMHRHHSGMRVDLGITAIGTTGETMFDRILQLLTGGSALPATPGPDELQVAVAALLVEAARMDDEFSPAERGMIEQLIAHRFALSPEATHELMATAERRVGESAHLYRFVDLVVRNLSLEERVRVIEMLWEVAYADGRLDPEEDALLRRMGALIHVPDRERTLARRRVLDRLGLAG
jgi:uncharacterized tellurite resistance protein B-like protein